MCEDFTRLHSSDRTSFNGRSARGWGGGKGDSVCAFVDNYYVNVDNTWQHRL